MAKKKIPNTQEIETYSAVLILSEEQITEAIAKVLAERGYIVTSVELSANEDGEFSAECFAKLPKSVTVPENQVQD